MSKKGGSSAPAPNTQYVDEYGQAAARIAQELYGSTQGVRDATTNQYTDLMGTQGVSGLSDVQSAVDPFIQNADALTVNPDNPTLFGGAKAALEQQFGNAKDQLMEYLPQGGGLQAGLTDLTGQRAYGLSQIMADLASQNAAARERGLDRSIGLGGAQLDINQRNLDRAIQLASGGTAGALQGFSVGGNLAANAAGIQASMYNAQQARRGAAKSGLGQGLGSIAGAWVGKGA